MAVDQLWGCLSTYLDHCASLAMSQTPPDDQSETAEEEAQAVEEDAQAAEEEGVSDAGNADRGLTADAAGTEAGTPAASGEEEESAETGEEKDAAEPSEAPERVSAKEGEQDDKEAENVEPVAAASNKEVGVTGQPQTIHVEFNIGCMTGDEK